MPSMAVIDTKLEILIADFQSFKRISLGFVVAVLVPFGAFVVSMHIN